MKKIFYVLSSLPIVISLLLKIEAFGRTCFIGCDDPGSSIALIMIIAVVLLSILLPIIGIISVLVVKKRGGNFKPLLISSIIAALPIILLIGISSF